MKTRFAAPLAVAAAALFCSQISIAATVTYNLNVSNTTPQFPNGVTWATVKIDDESGPVRFTVDPIGANPYYTPGSNFGISDFSFMVQGASPPATDIVRPSGWTVSYGTTGDGFGKFDVNLAGGGDRYDPLVFWINNANIANYCIDGSLAGCQLTEKSDKGWYYAAHIAGFASSRSGDDSFWVSGSGTDEPSVVPLPASLWLLGSGVLGLFGIGRRRTAS